MHSGLHRSLVELHLDVLDPSDISAFHQSLENPDLRTLHVELQQRHACLREREVLESPRDFAHLYFLLLGGGGGGPPHSHDACVLRCRADDGERVVRDGWQLPGHLLALAPEPGEGFEDVDFAAVGARDLPRPGPLVPAKVDDDGRGGEGVLDAKGFIA
eukprot:CAMPEP_0180298332 /NCGR_PEP_ID=MMETSP0988-20121125/21226_1 /TAXON_ID=697907 /ORGANISM="non described non described, Strain CCMP2293" /LENGTH=158 /DNA_ID=CAMNT_0022277471 /DNA_START=969 /DNA_END=1446 /DNA_ORIENTATION=+